MTSLAYFQAWLCAFALTQIVEAPLYRWFAPTTLLRAFSLSLVTHPVVWYVIPSIAYRAGASYLQMIWVAEVFAVVTEALLLCMYGVRWIKAFALALLVNGASVAVGELTRYYFGFP